MNDHLVLVGDSIFDNAVYVDPGKSVSDHLGREISSEAKLTLLAIDGDVAAGVPKQLIQLPGDATHIFMSVGGNDALGARGAIDGFSFGDLADNAGDVPGLEKLLGLDIRRFAKEIGRIGHLLGLLEILQKEFRRNYLKALDAVEATGLPAVVCTVYESIPGLEDQYKTALSIFDDVIVREASARRFGIIDLRAVCDEASDYSAVSPIEPSDSGGRKIAKMIAQVYRSRDFGKPLAALYG